MFDVLFQFGAFTIRTFNVCLAIAFLFGGIFALRFIGRQKMNLSFFSHYFLYIFFGIILGGRLLYIIENLHLFQANPLSAFFLWDLHFSFFGILYGMFIMLLVFASKAKEKFWAWIDMGVITMIFSMTFIHIGHFFNGTEYGVPTELPWGIPFDTQSIPFFSPIHPTQIYAALLAFIIFYYSLKKSKRVHLSGIVGSTALMLYSLGMLGIDFMHGVPSLYVKISFGIISMFSFVFLIHCSHKTYDNT